MNAQPSAQGRNPYLRAQSLAELLAWYDLDFVRCAYVTVLGRQPDLSGEVHYVEKLRRGHSKLEILWHLRRSAEGQKHDPGIAGLDRALRKAWWDRSYLGWLIRPFTRGEGDSQTWRRHRIIANWLGSQSREQQCIRLEVNQLDLKIDRLLAERPTRTPDFAVAAATHLPVRDMLVKVTASENDRESAVSLHLDSRARVALKLLNQELVSV